jgi:hypothetical protein
MKLQVEHHLPPSQRPDWLLLYLGLASAAFECEYTQGEEYTTLCTLSNLLDEQIIVKRTQQISGRNITREICDYRKLVVYSLAGMTRPYATISFVEE